jgi:hypothetical protein
MKYHMKAKHLKIIFGNLILISLLIIFKRLQVKDVVFIYLLVLIPAFFCLNIEFLFKRKRSYSEFIVNKLFINLIITIFIFSVVLFATQPRYIRKDKAVSDLNFMIHTLENVHPDIYHIISKDSFSLILNKEIAILPEKITELDFYKICARLTSHFRSGHTRVREDLLFAKFILGRAFPFETKIIDDKLFIINNLSLFSSIPVGSEIIEINNKSLKQIISEWSKLVSYENIAYRNYLITKPINIGIWNDFKRFRIKFIDFNSGKIKEKVVNGGVASNIYQFLKSKFHRPQKSFYKELAPEIGYIGFFSCTDLKDYIQFYQSTFTKIRDDGIKHLIIDIRDNGGGYSIIADELMQYIINQPFNTTDSAILKVSNELIATGKVKNKLWDRKDVEPGKTYTRIPELIQLRENPLRFKGNTYLLTNNGTFSAAVGFASAFRCYGHGTIIGEETGGVTVNFGDVHIFKLPNTGLKIMTSWEQAFSSCGIDNQRGVLPDFEVTNSNWDYVNNKDRVLEFTLNLIKEKKRLITNAIKHRSFGSSPCAVLAFGFCNGG